MNIAISTALLILFAMQSDPQPAQNRPHRAGSYVGVASCAGSSCHGSTRPLERTEILQNEYYTWLNTDRHAQAYNVLFNDESALIARNMKLRQSAYEARICLDCHTLYVPTQVQTGRIDLEDGVSCEGCHGPAGGWLAQHTESGWTHEQSVERGMIELRDIPTRGRLCLTCHLGDATKTVDHELIAAGHPRLAFELDNYTEGMPSHWKLGKESHGLRAWAVGQAVSFHQSLEQVRRYARSERWPEFAVMVCTDCHHELKAGEWRQRRGYTLRAGLPHWSPASYAVFRHLLSADEERLLSTQVPEVASQIARMRQPEAVAAAAGQASTIASRAVSRLENAQWSDAEVRRVMTAIARDRATLSADVQVAEQTALALQSLAAHLSARRQVVAIVNRLFKEVENADDYNMERFSQTLAELENVTR